MIYQPTELRENVREMDEEDIYNHLYSVLTEACLRIEDPRAELRVTKEDLLMECYSFKPIVTHDTNVVIGAELCWLLEDGLCILVNTVEGTIAAYENYTSNGGKSLCAFGEYGDDGRGYDKAAIALFNADFHLEDIPHPFGISSNNMGVAA
jgi:hypothetical protein